jgi:hypothetical protein
MNGVDFRSSSEAKLRSIPPIALTLIHAALDSGYHSESLLCRRSRPSQATLRSATPHFGSRTNPFEPSGRSPPRPGRGPSDAPTSHPVAGGCTSHSRPPPPAGGSGVAPVAPAPGGRRPVLGRGRCDDHRQQQPQRLEDEVPLPPAGLLTPAIAPHTADLGRLDRRVGEGADAGRRVPPGASRRLRAGPRRSAARCHRRAPARSNRRWCSGAKGRAATVPTGSWCEPGPAGS